MKTFTVSFDLTSAEEKALLQRYSSLDKMIGDFIAQQKEQAMKTLVKAYANGEKTADLTSEDKQKIEEKDTRIIKDIDNMPKEAMEIIVNKINTEEEATVKETK